MNNLHTHNFCKGCSKGNKIKKQNLKFAEFLDGSDLVRKRQGFKVSRKKSQNVEFKVETYQSPLLGISSSCTNFGISLIDFHKFPPSLRKNVKYFSVFQSFAAENLFPDQVLLSPLPSLHHSSLV